MASAAACDESKHLIGLNSDEEQRATREDGSSEKEARRSAILVTLPIFMGYAALVSFQADVKEHMGIPQKSRRSYEFGTAVSLLFLAALVFRLMHNVFLGFLSPRQRIVLAYLMMSAATSSVLFVVYLGCVTSVVPVFAVYIAGGIAVGTFEVNIVSFITPLGHQTKKWALLGMPFGYNGVSIGGFLLFSLFPRSSIAQGALFGAIVVTNLCGLAYFAFVIPNVRFEASDDNARVAVTNAKAWREWVPVIRWCCLCLFCDMFACILASTIALYMFEATDVALWPRATASIPQNVFLAIFNAAACAGDAIARVVAYSCKNDSVFRVANGNPSRFLVLTAFGLAMCLCKVALLAPIGMFLIMMGNGLLYASTTRFIDDSVARKHNLVALSFWLFTGDAGSFVAANVVTPLQNAIGGAS